MFRAATAAAARVWPGAPVFPRMSTGTTESTALRRAGIHAYGIDLFALTPDDARTAHAPNERIPVGLAPAGRRVRLPTPAGAGEVSPRPPSHTASERLLMKTPTNARVPLYLVLLASTLTACTWGVRPRNPEEESGPVARIWRKSAQTRDFERFTRQGTALTGEGALELDAASARSTPDPFPSHAPPDATTPVPPGSYVFGSAVSEEHAVAGGFDNVVPSFDALTPPGTWVRLTLAARVEGTVDEGLRLRRLGLRQGHRGRATARTGRRTSAARSTPTRSS